MKTIIVALLIATGSVAAGLLTANGNKTSAESIPSIPDWTAWKCDKVHLSHVIIQTFECHGAEGAQVSHLVLKVEGQKIPFLIGWGHDGRDENPGKKAYAAIFKEGKWVVGARGTGFTTQESNNSVTFFIFLTEDFSVREYVEIKIPEDNKPMKPVARITASSGN